MKLVRSIDIGYNKFDDVLFSARLKSDRDRLLLLAADQENGTVDVKRYLLKASWKFSWWDLFKIFPKKEETRSFTIQVLINHGANLESRFDDARNETPLMTAARKGIVENIRQLIAAGANVNAFNDHNSVLTNAVISRKKEVVEALFAEATRAGKEIDVNFRDTQDDDYISALGIAHSLKLDDIVAILEAHGARACAYAVPEAVSTQAVVVPNAVTVDNAFISLEEDVSTTTPGNIIATAQAVNPITPPSTDRSNNH